MLRTLVCSILRKVVEKNVHATIPKVKMGYDKYTVPDTYSCGTYFYCFPLALANIRPWPLVPFFQTSLKNSELKTTHDTFRDCRVHFFWTTFLEIAVWLAPGAGKRRRILPSDLPPERAK